MRSLATVSWSSESSQCDARFAQPFEASKLAAHASICPLPADAVGLRAWVAKSLIRAGTSRKAESTDRGGGGEGATLRRSASSMWRKGLGGVQAAAPELTAGGGAAGRGCGAARAVQRRRGGGGAGEPQLHAATSAGWG